MFYNVTGANYISGRTNSIAFHPSDANTMYIGAAGGGVWKTTDGGVNWSVLTDNLTSLTCGAVAVDQLDPSIVYYGTGELNYSLDSYYGDGVYKSTNAGSSWTKIATAAAVGSNISQISIHPTSSSLIFLSGSSGVYKSTNAGASWTSTSSGSYANCVIADPTDSQVWYTSIDGLVSFFGTVKKTTNGGTSWTTLGGGLPTSDVGRIQLAMAPSDHNTLYASIASVSTAGLLGLYKTTDGGAVWTLQASSPNYMSAQGWYDNAVCVKPTDPTFVVAGGLDNYTSSNSGVTLTKRTNWSTGTSSNMSHADIHFLGYRGTVLYCGSDGGVYKSTDDGVTWSDLNATLSTLQFQSADYDPTNLLNLYGGTQDNNKESSTNGGTTWTQRTTGDGGYTVVDPVTPTYIYGAYVNGSIQRSANSGLSYTEIRPSTTGSLFYNPYEMAPGDHNTIVYAVGSVWKTTTAQTATTGAGWSQIAASGTLGGSGSAIGISSTDINKIYVGTSNGRILATTNNGSAWTTTTGYPYVSDIVVDPTDDNVAYATFTGFSSTVHVYKTTNAGTSWFSVTGTLPNIPCNTIALRTSAPRTLFVGTDLGVYKSTDDGTTWVSFNTGLPPATVYDLKYKEGTQKLMVATHGRGCWTFDFAAFLPVQLASFVVFPENGNVRARWITVSETNNYGFEVQRSFGDEQSFQTIENSFIAGHGTTVQPHTYSFDDVHATSGRWYYRLKQIDLDGSVHYTGSVMVSVLTGVSENAAPTAFSLLQNYPNPFNPSTTIRYDVPSESQVHITLFNSLGQEVGTLVNGIQQPGRFSIEVSSKTLGKELASGIYYYRMTAGDFVQSRRALLLK
jgi:photosystem II stability/assembly factor-like uncharacterized protein